MLRILYAGSPEAAAIPLMHLGKAEAQGRDFTIVGVLTNPPSAQGRSKALIPTPVAQSAQKL
ncbi:MAG: methionyl-tRNA formyltransferase, partial [Spirochaetaceae bacterium]|nr:methionyl-tRNA formyltransferase [Spirochaetaceae bacterium]